jgi:acyl carrier protein
MSRTVSEAEIREWCVDHVARLLDRQAGTIDPGVKFSRLGLDSATMINLIMAVEEWLGIQVELEAVYEYRNINALSGYLEGLLKREIAASVGSPENGAV